MAIRISALRAASTQTVSKLRSLSEARSIGAKTAFLCHSHKDRDLAQGFVNLMAQSGVQIYVDWADAEMPEKPDRRTAERIQAKIIELKLFFFLATENSTKSRWCPWEVGYADGKKDLNSILVIPSTDGFTTHGSDTGPVSIYRSY